MKPPAQLRCDIVGHLAARRKETELVIFDPAFPLVAPAAQRSYLMLQLFRFATFSTIWSAAIHKLSTPVRHMHVCVPFQGEYAHRRPISRVWRSMTILAPRRIQSTVYEVPCQLGKGRLPPFVYYSVY